MLIRTPFVSMPFGFRSGLSTDFDRLHRQLDALFNAPFDGVRPVWSDTPARITETEEAFFLTLPVPGLKASELSLNALGDELTITGEHKAEVPEGYRLRRQERVPTRFSRRFRLNGRVATDQIDARLRDGMLTVTLPKRPEEQARTIEVKS